MLVMIMAMIVEIMIVILRQFIIIVRSDVGWAPDGKMTKDDEEDGTGFK